MTATVLKKGVGLVFFETPTNPILEILDIRRIVTIAHSQGAYVAVDNTFATPVNQQPLTLGADFVVHSATKYLGGHSDLTAGAILGSKNLISPIFSWRKNLGQAPSPDTCALLVRSLHTLVVRVERQNTTAFSIAQAMQRHHRIRRVFYPGLPDFPGHNVAMAQMRGYGGMLTIEVDGPNGITSRIVDQLKLFVIAPSLGGVESLATQPVTTSHHGLSSEELNRRGITDSMIRLLVGLEDSEDLIDDLMQALE